MRKWASHILDVLFLILFAAVLLPAQDTPADYQDVLSFLRRPGDFKDAVLKVNAPRWTNSGRSE